MNWYKHKTTLNLDLDSGKRSILLQFIVKALFIVGINGV